MARPAASHTGPGAAGGERVRVQADESANALVITAPAETMRALRQVVASLDVRRAQVLVEAVIAEVSVEQSAQLGVQWLVDGSGQAGVVGIVNFNNLLPTHSHRVDCRPRCGFIRTAVDGRVNSH